MSIAAGSDAYLALVAAQDALQLIVLDILSNSIETLIVNAAF